MAYTDPRILLKAVTSICNQLSSGVLCDEVNYNRNKKLVFHFFHTRNYGGEGVSQGILENCFPYCLDSSALVARVALI